jgi:hypothetical protein
MGCSGKVSGGAKVMGGVEGRRRRGDSPGSSILRGDTGGVEKGDRGDRGELSKVRGELPLGLKWKG